MVENKEVPNDLITLAINDLSQKGYLCFIPITRHELPFDFLVYNQDEEFARIRTQYSSSRALIDAKTRVDNPREKPHVIVSILTDGEENSSREFSRDQIFNMITEQKDKGWEFIFLAANQDAINAGMSMGIGANSSFNFKSTKKGMQRTSEALNYAVSNVRSAYAGYSGFAGTIGAYADDMKDILEDESDASVDDIVDKDKK